MIDLRSDTVTRPTDDMRRAIAAAEVGDDVFGDDPTVIELEQRTADLLGKPASLYVPSGTMANQLAIRCQTQPGDEILVEKQAHIYHYEAGGSAALSGVICRHIEGDHGIYTADDVLDALRPADVHYAPTKLVAIENTHNAGGGMPWPINKVVDIAKVASQHHLAVHMDGARLWNATAATGVSEAEYVSHVDTVSVCFSKGLGAPVGSALAGEAELIERARRFRKQFGGGMRQAGIIAAGALYALQHHRHRLVEDNENAKRLAVGLAGIQGITVDSDNIQTNIVYFNTTMAAEDMVLEMKKAGVLVCGNGKNTLRAVTNLMVNEDDIDKTIDVVRQIMKKLPARQS